MKLKYYLRGMGIGIILTAIVMGFALGGRKTTISDAEVIERAKALGMVDAGGTLSQTVETPSAGEENQTKIKDEEISDDTSASSSSLYQEGKEISEEDDQTVALASQPVSNVAKEEEKGKDKKSEESKSSEDASKQDAGTEEVSTASQEEIKTAKEPKKEETPKQENTKQEEPKQEEPRQEETKPAQTTEASSAVLGSTTSETKTVTIPGGIGSEQVSAILQREGLIDSAYSFNQYLCDKRMDRRIRSGTKVIPAGSTYEDIARIICKE